MKSLISKLGIILILSLGSINILTAQAFNVDPALTAAVSVAGANEKKALDKINEEQTKIRNLQTLASTQLKKIEDIQRKSYEYLSNISAGVQNAYDIKRSYELTKSIVSLCGELKKAVVDNPQGLITTVVATKYVSHITKEVAETYAYIANISLNKKTLLNSAERLEITWRVRTRLTNIHQRIYGLIYKIRALKFSNLPELLAPEVYYGIISQKTIAEAVIREYYR